VRVDPRLSGPRNNVFGIQTGVSIGFMVKRELQKGCRIRYARRPQLETAEEKLSFLANSNLSEISFEDINPDNRSNWLNQPHTDFETLVPLADDDTKRTTRPSQERAIFKLFGNGVNTARDEWVVSASKRSLRQRVEDFINVYNRHESTGKQWDDLIKWSRNLKVKLSKNLHEAFTVDLVRRYAYRPFVYRYAYLSDLLIDELGQLAAFDYGSNYFLNFSKGLEFRCIATDVPADFHFLGETRVIGRSRWSSGKKIDNITDWALARFRSHYVPGSENERPITKDTIFHYVYGVLHDPVYREKYALNPMLFS
jgi:predicted helicase